MERERERERERAISYDKYLPQGQWVPAIPTHRRKNKNMERIMERWKKNEHEKLKLRKNSARWNLWDRNWSKWDKWQIIQRF